MAAPSTIKVEIEGLDNQGCGIAHYHEETIRIPFVIPGEKLCIPSSLLRKGARPFVPTENDFIVVSPDRVIPPCPYFMKCGGCQLQQMNGKRQLFEKERWFKEMAADILPPVKIKPILLSPHEWNYRRRIQLHVGRKGEVGFFTAHGQQVVDIQNCLIAEEVLNSQIEEVRKLSAEILKSRTHPTFLTYELTLGEDGNVEMRQGDDERSFLQVNAGANLLLIQLLKKVVKSLSYKNVLELFAGSGNLTNALAEENSEWTAVEANSFALSEAKKKNSRVQWIQGDASRVLKDLTRAKKNYDLLLMDPPREGAGACVASILEMKIPWLLYISCDPSSLIKDLKRLLDGGYQVEWAQPIDFFPQTMHLETVVLLRGNNLRQID